MPGHHDLEAWKAARAVSAGVLRMSRDSWKPHLTAVFSQLQRSSLSAQLNISEGYASGPGHRCRYLLEVAYGSAVETDDLLQLLAAERDTPTAEIAEALEQCRQAQRLLKGLIRRYR